jgi:glycosyltransferase involved in cell wall biosynthesis
MPVLCLLFRKPADQFHSIERVFGQLNDELAKEIRVEKACLPYYSSSLLHVVWNILYARRRSADIFHVTGDVHYAVWGLPRRRTILTVHDLVFLHRYRGIKRRLLKWLYLDMPVRHCRLITTISEATKRDILAHTNCPADKIVVIPDPVDQKITHVPAVFNEKNPVILFVGSTPNKNLPGVIEALEGIDCTLTIIGKPSPEQTAMLKERSIRFVQLAGLSDEEMIGQYIRADLVLFPSTFEGFGLPVVEAQKAGRPVITSDLDPMREVAGGAACLVDPYRPESIREGVLKVIGNKEYREQLVEKGLINAERFSPADIGRRYSATYKKLLPCAASQAF